MTVNISKTEDYKLAALNALRSGDVDVASHRDGAIDVTFKESVATDQREAQYFGILALAGELTAESQAPETLATVAKQPLTASVFSKLEAGANAFAATIQTAQPIAQPAAAPKPTIVPLPAAPRPVGVIRQPGSLPAATPPRVLSNTPVQPKPAVTPQARPVPRIPGQPGQGGASR